jgi:hypothetical protein
MSKVAGGKPMANIVSIDRGKIHSKTVTASNVKGVSFPSVVAPLHEGMSFNPLEEPDITTVCLNGICYAVGESAFEVSKRQHRVTRHGRMQSGDEYLLYLAALGSIYPTRGGDWNSSPASRPNGGTTARIRRRCS